jgi:hypothetical protein
MRSVYSSEGGRFLQKCCSVALSQSSRSEHVDRDCFPVSGRGFFDELFMAGGRSSFISSIMSLCLFTATSLQTNASLLLHIKLEAMTASKLEELFVETKPEHRVIIVFKC